MSLLNPLSSINFSFYSEWNPKSFQQPWIGLVCSSLISLSSTCPIPYPAPAMLASLLCCQHGKCFPTTGSLFSLILVLEYPFFQVPYLVPSWLSPNQEAFHNDSVNLQNIPTYPHSPDTLCLDCFLPQDIHRNLFICLLFISIY